jgi:3'-5' exoribonuclease
MKKVFLAELKENDKVDDFFILKNTDAKTDKNGNYYLDLLIGDKSGDMICRKFRATNEEIERAITGNILRIKGMVKEYNGSKNLNAIAIEVPHEELDFEATDFVAAAPIPPDIMLEEIKNFIKKIKDKDIKSLVIEIYKISKDKLMYYPAAKSNHHAVKSGLLFHMLRMLKSAEALSQVYENLNMDYLYAGILLHDICKLDEMDADEQGVVGDYTMEGKLLGHIIMGIKQIEKTAERLDIERETVVLLEHMILSHHYHPEYGSPKKPMFLEAELLHYLDILDARIYDFQNALEGVQPGQFSDRVWVLDNRNVYCPILGGNNAGHEANNIKNNQSSIKKQDELQMKLEADGK